MLEIWNALGSAGQVAVVGMVAGAALYLVQRGWTNCPLLPLLGRDSTTRRKRLTALLLAVVSGWIVGQGDVGKAVAAAVTAYMTGQAAFLAAEKTSKEGNR